VIRPEGPTVPDNNVLVLLVRPLSGEEISVLSEDFGTEREALDAVARALDERRSLVLARARYDRDSDANGLVINLANVVSVRVSTTDVPAAGAYL